jgi:hypothetical protein
MIKVTEKINDMERIRVNDNGKVVAGTYSNVHDGKMYEWNDTFKGYYSVGCRNAHQLYLPE